MKLPVRVRPKAGESFIGYTLRIADTNGMSLHQELFQLIGISARIRPLAQAEHEMIQVCEALAPWLLIKPNELMEKFRYQFSTPWLYDERRLIRSIKVTQPKLCPECMQSDEPFFSFDWQLLPNTHCSFHQVQLIDSCPSCESALSWHTDLFRGCPICEIEWSQLDFHRSKIPSWQETFHSTETASTSSELYRFLGGLTRQVVISARPFDQYHDQLDTLPANTTKIGKLIAQATTQCKKSVEWPPEGFVRPYRLAHEDSLHYHCKHEHMTSELGLQPDDGFIYFVRDGLISPIIENKLLKNMVFDIRDAVTLIEGSRSTTSDKSSELISIDGSSELLQLFDAKYGAVISAAIKLGKAHIDRRQEDFSSVLIEKTWLQDFLNQQLQLSCQEEIPYYRAQSILQLKPTDIADLMMSRKLVGGRFKRIRGDSILGLIQGGSAVLAKRHRKLSLLLGSMN